MTVFDDAVTALMADPDIGVDAVHWPSGLAAGETVRLVLASDRSGFGSGGGSLVTDRIVGEVRRSALETIKAGDYFNAGGVWYRVEGASELSEMGNWKIGLRRKSSAP